MLPFLFHFSSEKYVEINKSNYWSYIGRKNPVFVKFYSPNCGYCSSIEKDFFQAASYFDSFIFGGINCDTNKEICYKITGLPTLIYYPSYSNLESPNIIPYKGRRTANAFVDFIEKTSKYTRIAHRPPPPLLSLDPAILSQYIGNKAISCSIVLFSNSSDFRDSLYEEYLEKIADSFKHDNNFSFSSFNCDDYPEECQNITCPQFKAWKNGNEIHSNEKVLGNRESIMKYINNVCETDRGIDGLVSDTYGVDPISEKYAQIFSNIFKHHLNDNDSEAQIEDALKNLRESDISKKYVNIAEEILEKGIQSIIKKVEIMEDFLKRKSASPEVLTNLKKKYNIYKAFIPSPSHTQTVNYNTEEKNEED